MKPRLREKRSDDIITLRGDNVCIIGNCCCPPYGVMSVVGRRKEMEDTVAVVPSFHSEPNERSKSGRGPFSEFHFFGVYDGHGGSQVSVFCRERLHDVLAEELRASSPSRLDDCRRDFAEWKKAMTNCFVKIDTQVGGSCPSGTCSFDDSNGNNYSSSPCCRDSVAPGNVGSTAVVAVVSPSQIIVANCGDSRAVLSRGGKAIPFSNDHRPEREDEMIRIEAAGGCVVNWNGFRVEGLLAMSRAIGDRFLKEYIISEPELNCTDRTEEDEFLILASDGLWDVLSNENVCDVARKCLSGYRSEKNRSHYASAAAVAAALLTKVALARGSTDNISVVVIDLKKDRQNNGRNNGCL
uniref:protein-serine/threonine phosphatase n=1 Tax=Araucaria cunninghamii TaxID=56994 RepID=A0A0D6QYF2_ARACU